MLAVATNNQQVIVGLGVTGLSCARYLSRMQQPFSVVDSRVNPPGLETFRKEFPSVSVSLGDISDADLQNASRLLVSPGIGLDQPAIARAIDSGIIVCGDIDLFLRGSQGANCRNYWFKWKNNCNDVGRIDGRAVR